MPAKCGIATAATCTWPISCLIDGEPTLFDCLEFDVAGHHRRAARPGVPADGPVVQGAGAADGQVLNRYLDRRDDDDGLPLMPAFMALRAAIRAHVVATQAAAAARTARAPASASPALPGHRTACLAPRAARLVAVGGLGGSGKSVLAAAIAPAVGAPPNRYCPAIIRKALHSVDAQARLPARMAGMCPEQVYAAQAERARGLLAAGCCVIADAVFDRPGDRERIAQAALARANCRLLVASAARDLVARVKASHE